MGEQPEHGLTHFAEDGRSRMVDVTDKAVTKRTARASGQVQMAASTLRLIQDREFAKGDVLEVARLAGIMAAKRTSDLIPLCHPLPISSIDIQFQLLNDSTLSIEATVTVSGKTGVEMEALSAVTIAALTVYDMCKSVEKGMVIGPIRLEEKDGGRSGHFVRQ
ncbi:MAG: cyclic pyranopterin monophosphate synthase MoaC [Pirellulaceae bacterium]|jgi:cyclic pyranopterin phosphate synthase|nr:cyclic pyranopterin monophosphate synthase MoaC [Planctomycetaceae bacterium]